MISTTWKRDLSRYQAYLKAEKRSSHYLTTSGTYLKALGQRYRKPYLELTKDEIIGWFGELADRGLRGKGLSEASLRAVFSHVRACIRFINDGETPASLKGLHPGKAKTRVGNKDELPTEEELGRLASALDAKWRAALYLTRYSGARPSEVLGLLRKDAALKAHNGREYAELTFRDTKTGETRNVPVLKPEAIQTLKIWRDLGPKGTYLFPGQGERNHLGYQAFWVAMKRAREKAGIEKPFSPYWLRHARASELYDKPPAIRDKAMGWKSGLMWKNYTHLQTEDVRDALWEETEGGPEIGEEEISGIFKIITTMLQRQLRMEQLIADISRDNPEAREKAHALAQEGMKVLADLREELGLGEAGE